MGSVVQSSRRRGPAGGNLEQRDPGGLHFPACKVGTEIARLPWGPLEGVTLARAACPAQTKASAFLPACLAPSPPAKVKHVSGGRCGSHVCKLPALPDGPCLPLLFP